MSTALSFEDIKKMRQGTNTYDVFDFPFMDGKVQIGVRVLTQKEVSDCDLMGRSLAKELTKDLGGSSMQDDSEYTLRYMLLKACTIVDIDNKDIQKPFFKSIDEVGQLSVQESLALVDFYRSVQEKYAPMSSLTDTASFDSLIEEVKKKSPLGMSLSTTTLRELVVYLADHTVTLPSDSGITSTLLKPSKESEKQNRLPERQSHLEADPSQTSQ